MGGESEQEGRGRVDNRRDHAPDRAALRLGALRLLLGLLLTLLGLFNLLAGCPPDRLARKGRGRSQGRKCHCADDETPLHIAEVTTQSMNGK
jgi:hypothetical protein